MKYAYGIDPAQRLARFFGVRGIPHAVLVDPGGTVRWRGHPGQLSASTIEAALEGALEVPLWDWPKEAKRVRKYLAAGTLGRALAEAEKVLAKGGPEYVLETVRDRVDARGRRMETAFEAGDYFTAQRVAEQVAKDLKGRAEGERADALLAQIEADPEKGEIAELLGEVHELVTEPVRNTRDAERRIRRLQKLRERHPNALVEAKAKAGIEQLRAAANS
jgi:thioredoxin-like negative regulator of GroEL